MKTIKDLSVIILFITVGVIGTIGYYNANYFALIVEKQYSGQIETHMTHLQCHDRIINTNSLYIKPIYDTTNANALMWYRDEVITAKIKKICVSDYEFTNDTTSSYLLHNDILMNNCKYYWPDGEEINQSDIISIKDIKTKIY